MEIRQLNENDISAYRKDLRKLLASCFDSTYAFSVSDKFYEEKLDSMCQYLLDGKAYIFGAFDEQEQLVGFTWDYECVVGTERRYHCAYIAVAPQFTRHGIANAFIAAMEEKARELGIQYIELAVGVENQTAQSLYRKQGFEAERVFMKKKVKNCE